VLQNHAGELSNRYAMDAGDRIGANHREFSRLSPNERSALDKILSSRLFDGRRQGVGIPCSGSNTDLGTRYRSAELILERAIVGRSTERQSEE
jgi:hypothetical protein